MTEGSDSQLHSDSLPNSRFAPMLAPAAQHPTDIGNDGIAAAGETNLATPEQLLAEHYDAVFSYAYRLTGNANAAEDVSQEVFLRALKSWHQLRDAQAAKGWLFVITRNEFSRWIGKFAPQPPLTGTECGSGESLEAGSERGDWVQRALLELPADYRVVVTMFYFEQLSYTEIARDLEIPLGTVMSRLNRARKHLKETLTKLAEPRNGEQASSTRQEPEISQEDERERND